MSAGGNHIELPRLERPEFARLLKLAGLFLGPLTGGNQYERMTKTGDTVRFYIAKKRHSGLIYVFDTNFRRFDYLVFGLEDRTEVFLVGREAQGLQGQDRLQITLSGPDLDSHPFRLRGNNGFDLVLDTHEISGQNRSLKAMLTQTFNAERKQMEADEIERENRRLSILAGVEAEEKLSAALRKASEEIRAKFAPPKITGRDLKRMRRAENKAKRLLLSDMPHERERLDAEATRNVKSGEERLVSDKDFARLFQKVEKKLGKLLPVSKVGWLTSDGAFVRALISSPHKQNLNRTAVSVTAQTFHDKWLAVGIRGGETFWLIPTISLAQRLGYDPKEGGVFNKTLYFRSDPPRKNSESHYDHTVDFLL